MPCSVSCSNRSPAVLGDDTFTVTYSPSRCPWLVEAGQPYSERPTTHGLTDASARQAARAHGPCFSTPS